VKLLFFFLKNKRLELDSRNGSKKYRKMNIETLSLSEKQGSNKEMTFWKDYNLVAIERIIDYHKTLFRKRRRFNIPNKFEYLAQSIVVNMLKRDEQGRENYCFFGLCAFCPASHYYEGCRKKRNEKHLYRGGEIRDI
jgi:hypothetical protein